MGYKIKVNHQTMKSTAKKIDQYNERMKKNMNSADASVGTMLATWKGTDASEFQIKWGMAMGNDSTYKHMYNSLEHYSDFLKAAAEEYKRVQIEAINKACFLGKW